MPLRIRRGTNAERQTITPLEGELIYVTDTKQVFVGDGNTTGGVGLVNNGLLTTDLDLNSFDIVGTGSINITGNISASGLVGNDTLLFKDDSIISLNTFTAPVSGTTVGVLNLSTETDHLQVVRKWRDPFTPLEAQYGISADISSLVTAKYSSRGSLVTPSASLSNDCISLTSFHGYDGNDYVFSSGIWNGVDPNEPVSPGLVPGTVSFIIQGPEGIQIGGFNSRGYLGIRTQTSDVTAPLTVNGNGLFVGEVEASAFRGQVLGDDSTVLVDTANNYISNGTLALLGNEIASYDTYLSPGLGNPIGTLRISSENFNVKLVRKFSDPLEPIEEQYGISNTFSSLLTQKSSSRGQFNNPEQLFAGDNITKQEALGYDGFDYVLSSTIWQGVDLTETVSPGFVPGAVAFIMQGPLGQKIVSIDSRGQLGINKFPDAATEALDVNGNGIFSGTVSAAAFKGSVFADDSTTMVDAITNTIYADFGTIGTLLTANSASIGSVLISNSTILTTDSSDIVVENNTNFRSDVTVDGRITADEFTSTQVGATILEAATDLRIGAGTAVIITNSPLRMASFTTAERDTILAENGDIIYNTSVNNFQTYQDNSWEDLFTTSSAFKGTVVADDSTIIIDGIAGTVTGNNVTSNSFVQFGQLTTTERDALTAVNGMVIYNTTLNKFQGYENGSWVNLI